MNGTNFKDGLGNDCWTLNGKYHRTDGPAYINQHMQCWYINGLLHRTDGPAVLYINGACCWYLDGIKYTFPKFCKKLNLNKEQVQELLAEYQ